MEKITVTKNNKAYAVDILKIVSGGFLSVVIVAIILIFRKSIAFISGKYSLLDFNLLFLILTVKLIMSGVKGFRKHKIMPKILLTYNDEKLIVLGDEINVNSIKDVNGKFEFGHTGTIILLTEEKTYYLYGVKNYANIINLLIEVVKNNKNKS